MKLKKVGFFSKKLDLLPQGSDWSKTHVGNLKPMILLGNNTPHEHVLWSKAPPFRGQQHPRIILETTKEVCKKVAPVTLIVTSLQGTVQITILRTNDSLVDFMVMRRQMCFHIC